MHERDDGLNVEAQPGVRGTQRGLKIHRRGADGKIEALSARPTDEVRVDDVVYVDESLF